MRWLLITTMGRNPGDEWIRIGIENMIREVDPDPHYICLDKDRHITHSYEVKFDKCILCGMPVFWSQEENRNNIMPWWKKLILGWPTQRKNDFLVLGAGSYFPYDLKDNSILPYRNELIESAKQLMERSFFIVARDHMVEKMTEVPIPTMVCPAVFAVMDYKKSNDLKIANLMSYGSSIKSFSPGESLIWRTKVEKIAQILIDNGFIFVAHDLAEVQFAQDLGFRDIVCFNGNPYALLEYYGRCGKYFGNRMHGALVARGNNADVWAVGYDSRMDAVKLAGGKVIAPSNLNFDEIAQWAAAPAELESFDMQTEFNRQLEIVRKFMHSADSTAMTYQTASFENQPSAATVQEKPNESNASTLDSKTRKPTLHFFYSGDPYDDNAICAPNTKANKLYRFLSKHLSVKHYQWNGTTDNVEVAPNDIILGHPHPDRSTTIWKLFEKTSAKKYLIWPFHSHLPQFNRYTKELAEKADKLFLVSGPYWLDTLEDTEFAGWKDKIIRVDNAVDAQQFSLKKHSFNPEHQRGLFIFGRSGEEKGIKQLFNLCTKTDCPLIIAGRFTPEDLQFIKNRPNTEILGPISWNSKETTEHILQKCDFFINMSVSDASPSTLLECMALGLIPITTPQCGYYYPSFFLLSLDDTQHNLLTIKTAQEKSSDELKLLQTQNRQIIEKNHNWQQFCQTVWNQIQKDLSSQNAVALNKKSSEQKQSRTGETLPSSPVVLPQSSNSSPQKVKVAEDYVKSGMKVGEQSSFDRKINEIFTQIRPKKIIETGTYLGTGTTTIIAKALQTLQINDYLFYTIEVNPQYYQRAKAHFERNNIRVTALNGLTVPRSMLPTPEQIARKTINEIGCEDIFVDHREEERVTRYYGETDFDNVRDNLLYECLKVMDFNPDFVLLDSGGHMGEIEFNYLIENLRGPCCIALDDIYHVKHHKSFERIKSDSRFEILVTSDEKFGFCIAKFNPAPEPERITHEQQASVSETHLSGIEKVLIVRPDSIGDFVIFSGILQYFRKLYKDAEITILLQKHIAQIAQTCPHIDRVLTFDRKKFSADLKYSEQLLTALKNEKFDVAVNPVYSRDILGDFLTLNCGAGFTIASYGDETNITPEEKLDNDCRYSQLVHADPQPMLETRRNEEFINNLGIVPDKPCKPAVWLTGEDRNAAKKILDYLKIQNPIVVCPFGQYDIRDWPIHKWAQLLDSYRNHPILICGIEKDKAKAEQIINLTGHPRIYNLCGQTTLRQLAALLEKAALCLCAESAAGHIAAALQCPQVIITGGGHFGRFVPYSPTTTMVYLPMTCYNCNWLCPYKDKQVFCISQIKVETVDKAVRKVLDTPRNARTKALMIKQTTNADTIALSKSQPEQCSYDSAQIKERPLPSNPRFLVTAIVSTYNSEEQIAGCLDDLLSQTIADRLEIVVVDSGSKQNEKAVVQKYQEKHGNIKYIRTEKRESVYKAWNRAIEIASGQYITNANTDDRHKPDALEIMVKTLHANPQIALVYCDQKWVDDAGMLVEEYIAPEHSRFLLLSDKGYVSSNPVWRKSLHNEFGLFEGDLFFVSGDQEFWLRISQNYDFLHINETLGIRRFTPDCISRKNVEERNGINHLEIALMLKCYYLALQKGFKVDSRGLSQNPEFAHLFELRLLSEKLRAKLEGKKINPRDYVQDIKYHRKNITPQLSIIINHHRRRKSLINTLPNLNNQSNMNFEVIVIDKNIDHAGLDEKTAELNYDLCTITMKDNFGPSLEKNVAINKARANIVAFLDERSIPDPDFVKNICQSFQKYDIYGLRGKTLPLNEKFSVFAPDHYDVGNEIVYSACESDSNCAFRKDVLLDVGGFDVDLPEYAASELSYKIFMLKDEKLDRILYLPQIITYQDYVRDLEEWSKNNFENQIYRYIANRKWLWQKYSLGLDSFLELIRDSYPANRNRLITDYRKLINVAIILQEKNPHLAIQWAQKALTANPSVAKGHYLLGSLYFRLADFNKATESLGKTLELFLPALAQKPSQNTHREIEKFQGVQSCYLSCCTKLAHCYMVKGDFENLEKIYNHMLINEHLLLPDDLKTKVRALLEKLRSEKKISSSPAAPVSTKQNSQKPVAIEMKRTENKYLVTAIVSTYNAEKFITGCLEDLENQTIADKLEIIVVNSASQQNEEAIIKQFQQKFDNIKYIKTENTEPVYTAWNRAVQIAQGKYITNANTDDRRRKDALEIMSRTLDENPDAALVYADQLLTTTPNDTFEHNHATKEMRQPDYSPSRLLFGCCVGSQPMWRKSLHDELGLFDDSLTVAGDWDFWLRISKKYKFVHIPEFLGLYYNNPDGIENSKMIHSLYERYLVGARYGNPYISIIPTCEHKDNPLVSIIMPAYNAAEFIAPAIESALIQNYRNFELIIVDDGSTDNTKQIIDSFQDEKIKYFYQSNAGLSAARNLGLRHAQGQYIVLLDADDMLTTDYIARHLAEFERAPNADLVYCNDCLMSADEKPVKILDRPSYSDRKNLIRDMFRKGYPSIPFRGCIKKQVFDIIGPYDEDLIISEDYDIMRRFLKHNLQLRHLPAELYLRRLTHNQHSMTLSEEKAKCHFEVIRRYTDTFAYDELFPDVRWERIPPENRPLHSKILASAAYMAIAKSYLDSSAPEYGKAGIELARNEVTHCLRSDPDNPQLLNILEKCGSYNNLFVECTGQTAAAQAR